MQRDETVVEASLRSPVGIEHLGRAFTTLLQEVERPVRDGVVLVVLTLAEVASAAGVAVVAKVIVDDAVAGRGVAVSWVGVAAGLALVGMVVTRARRVHQERIVLSARANAVDRVAHVLNDAPYTDLAAVPMAELRELLMTDVDVAYRFFVEAIGQACVVLLWLVATTAVIAWLSPPVLAALAALAIIAVLVFGIGIHRHLALTGPRFVALAETSQRAREVVEVDRVLLARQLGVDDLFVRAFSDAHAVFLRIFLAQQRLAAVLRATITGLNSLAFVGVVAIGGSLIASGRTGAGALIAMLFVIGQLIATVNQSAELVARAAETARVGRRLGAWWDHDDRPGSADDTGPRTPSRERLHTVRARGVGFTYDAAPAVHDTDVDLRRGDLACMTGATGAGKTTLGLLLTGILTPDTGRVTCNDDPDWHPQHLAAGRALYLGTRPILLAGSVRDNLLLPGDQAAGADLDWFERATGLATDEPLVGPNGTGVSSGQAQLIALARVVVRDPDLVVLDEATSALDMANEARVQRDLLDWCRDRITLVISHRTCPWTELADHALTLGRT